MLLSQPKMEYILIDDQSPDFLTYNQGGKVIIFDKTYTNTQKTRTVTVQNNTHLEWYGMITGGEHYSLHFITESGESIIRILLLAHSNQHIRSTIHSTLACSNTLADLHILSFAWENGIITLNGVVEIVSGIQKVSGHILEENIFLGTRWQILWIPSLLVHSADVQAWHAARTERISDEKLYYLRSHGISRNDATIMMIQSSVSMLFSWLDSKQQEAILDQILTLL